MPKSKPSRPQTAPRRPASTSAAFNKAVDDLRHHPSAFPSISGRWILGALGILLLAGLACAWGTLCLLYWQGSWQLLYHPKAEITQTPASFGLPFESVKFATTETGTTRLTGWWIPASPEKHLTLHGSDSFSRVPGPEVRFTVLYLHGADGNLGDSLDMLAALHRQNLNVFAIDYRGYGQSQPGRPTEKQLRQDAEWALTWLTVTRLLPAKNVIVAGTGLGANLAAELAADHAELGGAVLNHPLQNPMALVFEDSRSRLVPAHWLVNDRFNLTASAASLKIPSLWLFANATVSKSTGFPEAYLAAKTKKTAAWLESPSTADSQFEPTLGRWIDDL